MTGPEPQVGPNTSYWKTRPRAPLPGTRLGPLAQLGPDGTKEFVFGAGPSAFRMFVVYRGGQITGYLNLCPHYSSPLNIRDDEFLAPDGGALMCRRHFALFRIEDGMCISGACVGKMLDPIPVLIRDGEIEIAVA
jgi:nitrite reductase/ring-hydroxylating ferredoxin subunit